MIARHAGCYANHVARCFLQQVHRMQVMMFVIWDNNNWAGALNARMADLLKIGQSRAVKCAAA